MDNLASYKEFLRNIKTESSASKSSISCLSFEDYYQQNAEITARQSQSDFSEMTKKQQQNQIINEMQNYFSNKWEYDDNCKQQYEKITALNEDLLIDIYCKSTIKLSSLQQTHNQSQIEKSQKQLDIKAMKEKLKFFDEESQLIGQYLKKIELGDFSQSILFKLKVDDENQKSTLKQTQMPKSIEGLQISAECLEQQNIRLKQNIFQQFQQIDQAQTKHSDLLKSMCKKLNQIKEKMSDEMIKNSQISSVQHILNRYQMIGKRSLFNKMNKNHLSVSTASRQISKRQNKDDVQQQSQISLQNKKSPKGLSQLNKNNQQNFKKKDEKNQKPVQKSVLTEEMFDQDLQMNLVKETRNLDNILLTPRESIESQRSNQNINQVFLDIKTMIQFIKNLEKPFLSLTKFKKHNTNLSIDNHNQIEQVVEDFDPIFRKQDHQAVIKNVSKALSLHRKISPRTYNELKKQLILKMDNQTILDDSQIAFSKEDQRKQKIQDQNDQKEALIKQRQYSFKCSVKDSLWKKQISDTDLLKKQLLFQKSSIQNVQRQEKEFIDDLKDNIHRRYINLKRSVDSDLINNPKNLMNTLTDFNQISQFQPNDTNKIKQIRFYQDSSLSSKMLNNQTLSHKTLGANQKTRNQLFGDRNQIFSNQLVDDQKYFEPLKSPCFDITKRKPVPQSASLKERIKINNILTTSPKSGLKVGTNQNIKQSLITDQNDHYSNQFFSQRTNSGNAQKKQQSGNSLIQNFKNQFSSKFISLIHPQAYTSNKAFNQTYKTINMNQAFHQQYLQPKISQSPKMKNQVKSNIETISIRKKDIQQKIQLFQTIFSPPRQNYALIDKIQRRKLVVNQIENSPKNQNLNDIKNIYNSTAIASFQNIRPQSDSK